MKIVSWNINGLRATLRSVSGQDLRSFLDGLEADVICFQETKATRDQIDESLYLVDGYNAYFSFCRTKKGYAGVVTFCRNLATPIAAEEGLTGILSSGSGTDTTIKNYGDFSTFMEDELGLLDSEGRAVLTEHAFTDPDAEARRRMVIVNVYCPMYDPARDEKGEGLSRLQYKMSFYHLLEARCSALERAGKVVLVVGDLNCSPEAIDSAYMLEDPSLGKESQSKEWMRQFTVTKLPTSLPPSTSHQSSLPPSTSHQSPLPPSTSHQSSESLSPSTKLLDTFRYLNPTKKGAYSCWSTLLDYRKTNYGTRIDYILTSCCLANKISRAEVWQHIQGSDHCPVFAEFNLKFLHFSEKPLPALCSCWFSGKQSKLSDFITCQTTDRGNTKGMKRSQNIVEPPPSKRKLKQRTLFSSCSSNSQSSSETDRVFCEGTTQASGGLSTAWKEVFSQSLKAPPCSGHKEACVLRKVKKEGPNKDRQFWVCTRPGGSKGDPQARCDFFKWVKEKKK